MALALSVVLMLGCIGIVFGSSKPAGAATAFTSGQVFASVGNSAVNVYSQGSGDPLLQTLNDGQDEPYTAGSAFDSSGNFYVTDDYSGDVSEYAPDGTLDGVFASGLQNPLSLAFDNQGNLYVGQQTTPYIAEFSKTGQFIQNIGPLATELSGDDWIALSPDECTFYYTTEGSDILRYNKCTNQQLPNFNVQSFPTSDPSTGLPVQAFELQILPERGRAGGGFECGHPARPERQRAADLHLRVVARLPGIAVRHKPRPRRQFVLDRGFDLRRRLEGRHRVR